MFAIEPAVGVILICFSKSLLNLKDDRIAKWTLKINAGPICPTRSVVSEILDDQNYFIVTPNKDVIPI